MADMLAASPSSFAQDRSAWLAPAGALPGCRRLDGTQVVVVRHLSSSTTARDAFAAHGVAWPDRTGDVAGSSDSGFNDAETCGLLDGSFAVRRQPGEMIIVGLAPSPAVGVLLAVLAPGNFGDVGAVDVSDGMLVAELQGPYLDDWLEHLVDAMAIPRLSGRATRARLADISVLLVRLGAERLLIVAERPLAPYLANWLAFAHAGAFGSTST